MSIVSIDLAETLTALTHFWKNQGVACPPLEPAYVREVSAAHSLLLPPDFEQMYCALNGTPALYPNWLDDNCCSFLPIEALRPERKQLWVMTDGVLALEEAEVTVFVDFMQRSWEYGFIPNADGIGYRIGIIPTDSAFEVLTTSLKTFLDWYIEDADILYDYDTALLDLPS